MGMLCYVQTSRETGSDGETVLVTTLVLRDVAASAGATYTCKPQDDIFNMDADEIQVIVATANS